MKKRFAVAAVVAVLITAVAIVIAASADDSPESIAADQQPASEDESASTDDDIRSGGQEEDVPSTAAPEELEIDDEPADTPRLDRSAVLADLSNAIASRSDEFTDRVVELTEQHSSGGDVAAGLAELVDDVAVMGEGIITGVALSPETIEAVPDLPEVHRGLIARADRVYEAAIALDPSASEDQWRAAADDVLAALDSLSAFALQSV